MSRTYYTGFYPSEDSMGAKGSAAFPSYNVELQVYKRASTIPATPTTGSYNFDGGLLTPPSGWTVDVPSGSDILWICKASVSTYNPRDIINPITWGTPAEAFPDALIGLGLQSDRLTFRYDSSGTPILGQDISIDILRQGWSGEVDVALYRLMSVGSPILLDSSLYITASGTVVDETPSANMFTTTGNLLEISTSNYDTALDGETGLKIVVRRLTDSSLSSVVTISSISDGESSTQLTGSLVPEVLRIPVDRSYNVISYSGYDSDFVIKTPDGTDVSSYFTLSTDSGGNIDGLTISYTLQNISISAGLAEPVSEVRVKATGTGPWLGYTLIKTLRFEKDYPRLFIDLTGGLHSRNSLIPDAPTLVGTPSISRTFTTGNVTLAQHFSYTANTNPEHKNCIDGFEVGYYASSSSTPYTFGTDPNNEVLRTVVPSASSLTGTFPWHAMFDVNADLYYTIAWRAVRKVDADINATTWIKSAWAQTSTPYRPSSVLGYQPTKSRLTTPLPAVTFATDGSAVDHISRPLGHCDMRLIWSYSGSEQWIDGFEVGLYKSTSATAYTPGTTPTEEQRIEVAPSARGASVLGVDATTYYTWMVRPFRRVDPDIDASGRIVGAWAKPTLSFENPYRPSSSIEISTSILIGPSGNSLGNVSTWSTYANAGLDSSGNVKPDKVNAAAIQDQALIKAGYAAQSTLTGITNETYDLSFGPTITTSGPRLILNYKHSWRIIVSNPTQGQVWTFTVRGFVRDTVTNITYLMTLVNEEYKWLWPSATGTFYTELRNTSFESVVDGQTLATYQPGVRYVVPASTIVELKTHRYLKCDDVQQGQ